MRPSRDEMARLEQAYRRSRWKIIGHAVFLGLCCGAAVLLRRNFRLGPTVLFTVIVVALLAFAGDIVRMFYCRNELRRLRATDNTP